MQCRAPPGWGQGKHNANAGKWLALAQDGSMGAEKINEHQSLFYYTLVFLFSFITLAYMERQLRYRSPLATGLHTLPASPPTKEVPESPGGRHQSPSSRTLLEQARQFEEFCARLHTGSGLHSTSSCTHLPRPQPRGKESS